MKTLACMDIDPSSNCHFEAKGETVESLMEQMKAHMVSAHSDKMEQMKDMSEEDMMKMLMTHVKDVA